MKAFINRYTLFIYFILIFSTYHRTDNLGLGLDKNELNMTIV